MCRIKRSDLFSPEEEAIVHVMNRTVRLCGEKIAWRNNWQTIMLTRMAQGECGRGIGDGIV